MTSTMPATDIQSFRKAARQAKFPCALAGAGLSAASGIPTFRGAGGLWRQHDAMQLATNAAFQNDPSKVWQFYHYRREICLKARPNYAHDAVAFLATQQGCREIFPNAQDGFQFITQNVDGLSVRAQGRLADMSSRPPIEMHGSLFRTRCTECQDERENFDSPIVESLRGTENMQREYASIDIAALPRCKRQSCGGLLRPAVVWFGESIPLLDKIHTLLERCDLLLVLGTSSTVYPAAMFATQIQRNGGQTAVFNIEESENEQPNWFFKGGVEECLPWALGLSQQPP